MPFRFFCSVRIQQAYSKGIRYSIKSAVLNKIRTNFSEHNATFTYRFILSYCSSLYLSYKAVLANFETIIHTSILYVQWQMISYTIDLFYLGTSSCPEKRTTYIRRISYCCEFTWLYNRVKIRR